MSKPIEIKVGAGSGTHMGMQTGRENGKLIFDINVTPMVDVMLVLLIIFMVVAPLLQPSISIGLPKAKNPELDTAIVRDDSAVVSIPRDGFYYVGRERVLDSDEVPRRVAALLKGKRQQEQVVYIKAARDVKYGELVRVVESLREAQPSGWDRIGLVAEKNDGANR